MKLSGRAVVVPLAFSILFVLISASFAQSATNSFSSPSSSFSSPSEFSKALQKCETKIVSISKGPKRAQKMLPGECYFLRSAINVTTENGTAVVDARYIADDFRHASKEKDAKLKREAFDNISKRIKCLRSNSSILFRGPDGSGSAGFKIGLDDILGRKEYQNKKPFNFVPKGLREWWKKMLDRLPKWEINTPVAIGIGAVIKSILLLICIFIAIYILALVFGETRFARARKAEIPEAGEELLTDPRAIISEANIRAKAGNFREALRYMYISFVSSLERGNLVTYSDTKTNRECISELSRKKKISKNLIEMSLMYENCWYGMRECDPEQYSRFCGLYTKCLEELF